MTDAPAAPAAPPPATPPATPPAAPPADGSLFDGLAAPPPPVPSADGDPPAAPPATSPAGDDWLPEKFRVNGADGKLDEAASARKMAESYKALEAHKGALPQVPATPADYVLEPPKDADGKPREDFDATAFAADPLFQAFATDAHAAGLTNQQLQFVVDKYVDLVPQLIAADQTLTMDEAKAELATVWKDDATLQRNLAGVVKAINGFGAEAEDVPGSRARLMAKYGRDPDFIAFAATVAGEMKEDTVPANTTLASDADVESLQRGEAYWNPQNPDHKRVKAQVDTYYTRKFGSKRR